ncbi:hypothetical protein B0J11DRAFT_545890 [Dendryphion nanum]|uniref:Uncharacterized protein n=1 Tax=Dendryphion nanum TaxID=256645 RepID=A0A9P9EJ13_9PLEO|nr:hypothetical protein B0J11DRAFT_545890 [Dendryphion nanum]
MSSWGVRKPLRTYSRQKKPTLADAEPPQKRRCVESISEPIEEECADDVDATNPTISSSPVRDVSFIPTSTDSPAIFSDEPPKSTPPSSPLPPASSPPIQTRRPMFSFMKRKSRPEPKPIAKEPLAERSDNISTPIFEPAKKKRLVQMQLDLVGELRKTCKVCGMEYIPSNTEDAALHRKFHNMNIGGVDFSKAFVEKLKKNQVWAGGDGSFIAVIRRGDALALRNKAVEVLKVVNTELGAVPISEEVLWSQINTTLDLSRKAAKAKGTNSTSERFKVYLYVLVQKCVGACVAERIQEAYTVLDQDDVSEGEASGQVPGRVRVQSSSISFGTAAEHAMLGISRIWTSNLHRKLGIASRLLDSARSDFLYGMTLEKGMVAFSQPTESGGQLARKCPLPPARTKKSVRIESPTSSPPHADAYDEDEALSQRLDSGRYVDSLHLTSPAAFPDHFEDHIAAESSYRDHHGGEAYEGRYITRKGGGNSEMVGAVQSPTGAPANPFSRTLATIESQEHRSTETAGQHRDRTAAEKARANAVRGSLDVEGFKKLLMTGISGPTKPGQHSQPATATAPNPVTASILESSSSTSSTSRQSVFEPVQESLAESPRTSYEMAASDDERVGLVADLKKPEKKKPPPPKHRHGKPVSARAPQTVSFSDFSASELVASSPVLRTRTNSDLNKPLPAPPVTSPPIHIVSQDITHDVDELAPLETKNFDLYSYPEPGTPQKKAPPPVPLARRHSQLRTSNTTGNRSRSNSALTTSSQHSTEFPLLSPGSGYEPTSSPSSSKAPPPPPPPARRHGASLTNNNNTPSPSSSTTELPLTSSTARPAATSPIAPSSRKSTFSSQPPASPDLTSTGLSRTSSITSTRNNPRSVSNESTTSTMPPPPPPPRRRQSNRSSIDKERPHPLPTSSPTESRRTSAEHKRNSIDNKRRTSVASESSLRYEYAPSAAENEQVLYSPKEEVSEERLGELVLSSSSILDDMERFQREIDALRDKYKPNV